MSHPRGSPYPGTEQLGALRTLSKRSCSSASRARSLQVTEGHGAVAGTAQTRGEDGEGQTAGLGRGRPPPKGGLRPGSPLRVGAHRAMLGVSTVLLWQALAQFEVSKEFVTVFCISILPSEVSSGVRGRSRGRELIKASRQGARSQHPSCAPRCARRGGAAEGMWQRPSGPLRPRHPGPLPGICGTGAPARGRGMAGAFVCRISSAWP